jgi:hypothetical protein
MKRLGVRSLFDVLPLFFAGERDVCRLTAGAAVNSDNRPIVEVTLPFQELRRLDHGGGHRVTALWMGSEQLHPPVHDLKPEQRLTFYLRSGQVLAPIRPRHAQARRALSAR